MEHNEGAENVIKFFFVGFRIVAMIYAMENVMLVGWEYKIGDFVVITLDFNTKIDCEGLNSLFRIKFFYFFF